MCDSSFYEETDDLILECDHIREPGRKEVIDKIRRLSALIERAPETVKTHIRNFDESRMEVLLSAAAYEQTLLDLCLTPSVMLTRNPQRFALATVAIPSLSVERTFSTKNSLPLALAGAIGLAILDIIARSQPDLNKLN